MINQNELLQIEELEARFEMEIAATEAAGDDKSCTLSCTCGF
jgi:hypothetical protein